MQALAAGEENNPVPHPTQSVEPASGEANPSKQGVQVEAFTAPGVPDALPGGHERQPEDVCPAAPLNVPAAQSVQFSRDVAPSALRKRPAGQGLQATAPSASEKKPRPQSVHCVAPAKGLKAPAAQGAQASATATPPAATP